MTLTESDTALRRIRGLLDQAENTPYPDEAETFAAKAAELMARYRIDQAMLLGQRSDRSQIVESDIELGRGQYVRARLLLLGVVAEAFDCRLVTSSGPAGRTGHVIGHHDDVDQVAMLYTSLLLQATRAADHEPTPRGHSRVTFRRGFLMGFADRVGDRLAAQMASAVRSADGTTADPGSSPGASHSVAVVLADRREVVDNWVTDKYGRLGRLGPAAPVSRGSTERGQAAGDRADLGGRAFDGRSPMLGP